jgi:hypothetical protein
MKWMHDHEYMSISNGGLTGTFASGTSSEYEPEFLIRAKSTQYVDMVVSFGVDDSLDVASPNVGLFGDSLLLADADIDKHVDVLAKGAPRTHGSAKPHNRGSLEQKRRTPT